MKTHYSEADLLETYYLQPGESMPVMMHLASCSDCAARYERLDRKMREAAACHTERPETFWTRQRLSIMRRIAAQPQRNARIASRARIAAAALLAFTLGGALVYQEVKPIKPVPAPVVASTAKNTAAVEDMHAPINPWESEELKEFHDVVQWESWVADSNSGGGSL